MEDENKAVKANDGSAANHDTEFKNNEGGSNDSGDSNIEDVLKAKDAEIAKIAEERDNYQKGMLLYKGKLDKGADEDIDYSSPEAIKRIATEAAKEALFSEKELILQREKDEIIQKTLRENNELKVALKNKANISNSGAGTGGNLDKPKGDAEFWSPEQIEYLKKRGVDPEKAKENYLKLKNN